MIDCLLIPHPTDPALCVCETCRRTLPIRLLHAHRNCIIPPTTRDAAERKALAALCQTCDRLGQVEGVPICGLDLPEANRRKLAGKESCAKAWLKRRYRERLEVVGGECDKWQEWLALHPAKSDTMKPDKEDPDHGMVGPELLSGIAGNGPALEPTR